MKFRKNILPLILFTLIPTLLIWLPFFAKISSFWKIPLPQNGMATIVANYDGPLYIVVAKSFYNPEFIRLNYSFPIPVEYYAAHFPLFPAAIRLFSGIFGFPYSMLLITVVSSFIAIFYFYKLIIAYLDKKDALWITFVFSIFPARFLISRSVGSADPLFVAGIIASLYYFKNNKYFLAGIWGGIAQLTKSPAILLFVSYVGFILAANTRNFALYGFKKWFEKLELKNVYPIFFIPLTLLLVFLVYQSRFGNFLAYFNSGDNIHLFFPPFQIFNYSAPWVGTSWLEEIIFVYLIGGLGLLKLIQMKESVLAWFVGVFFTSILFVSHRDLIRYALPVVPFLFIAFSDSIVKKQFKFLILLLIIPIYLFTLSFISQNVMPISDWSPFL